MKKILVIINKNWETEPVLNALTNPKLRPAALPFPDLINTPCDGDNRMSQPRAIFFLSPITDRLNHFNEDVTDTQNYVSAFNRGLHWANALRAGGIRRGTANMIIEIIRNIY